MIGHNHGGGGGQSHGADGAGGSSADQVAAKPGSHGFRGRLAITFGLTAAFFVVELVVGLLSGSLALVADAGHMATDVLALGASLVATQIAARPDGSGRRTYGRYRSEVFAAGFAVLLMVGVGAFIVYEAISRMGTDPDVSSTPMVIVGLIGLAVNAVGLVLLRTGSCLLYTSPSPRDLSTSRMPSSA